MATWLKANMKRIITGAKHGWYSFAPNQSLAFAAVNAVRSQGFHPSSTFGTGTATKGMLPWHKDEEKTSEIGRAHV